MANELILIVEDNPKNLKLVSDTLQVKGYQRTSGRPDMPRPCVPLSQQVAAIPLARFLASCSNIPVPCSFSSLTAEASMPSFLNPEQQALAKEIAALLTDRGQTVAVAEATSGGLISAALLWVPGASRYYAGGGVLYTLDSRVVLAGAPAELFANYRGTTPEMIGAIAASMRQRTRATWCVAESGLAGPTGGRSGAPPGRTVIGVAGPVNRTEIVETNLSDREANMVEFTTRSLRLFRDVLREAKA